MKVRYEHVAGGDSWLRLVPWIRAFVGFLLFGIIDA
ncbi:Hypothetical protein NGAL_HAMBI490_39700 [Neorhizobium galegae bv. officinalis]|nr:Hypothetical protein NGAL_HAMBI490_39700 [Neorhizobium galegae bv. officinalis]